MSPEQAAGKTPDERFDSPGGVFHPEGELFALGSQDDGCVYIYVENRLLAIRQVTEREGWAVPVAWSPNGRWLAVESLEGIHLLDVSPHED
jgi:WD40 repeat protein